MRALLCGLGLRLAEVVRVRLPSLMHALACLLVLRGGGILTLYEKVAVIAVQGGKAEFFGRTFWRYRLRVASTKYQPTASFPVSCPAEGLLVSQVSHRVSGSSETSAICCLMVAIDGSCLLRPSADPSGYQMSQIHKP